MTQSRNVLVNYSPEPKLEMTGTSGPRVTAPRSAFCTITPANRTTRSRRFYRYEFYNNNKRIINALHFKRRLDRDDDGAVSRRAFHEFIICHHYFDA